MDSAERARGEDTDDMVRAMAAAGYAYVEGPLPPLFNPDAIAAALVDRHGRIVCASPAFAALGGAAVLDADLVARVADGLDATTAVAALPDTDEAAVFAYSLAARTSGWRLPPDVATAAAAHPGHIVVLTGHAGRPVRPLEEACRAHGFSGLQTRVVLATIRTGHVREAAEAVGVSYHTAREALGEAMRRAQARRLPAFVQRLSSLAFGALPAEEGEAETLGDLWGLNARQAAIAGLVADGLSRAETAAALALSEAVVKKELDRTYGIMQVDSAATLARRIVEARALGWLTRATAGDIGYLEPSVEPLQFVARPGGGRIAVSDYGPASGRPLLVTHPSILSRIVPRRLLRALQGAGYRPIAIDRPGFGLSDMTSGSQDCWLAAARDAVAVLDALRIGVADLVSHQGGAQFVAALGRLAADRLARVVLVNPDPASHASSKNVGVWGIMKHAFVRNPSLIRFACALIARQLTYEVMVRQFLAASRGSAPDVAAYRDPEIARDVFRAMRALAPSHEGVVAEEVSIARDPAPPPLPGADWRVLIGGTDVLHHPEDMRDFWRAVLPDARFEIVKDAGRLLSITHPHLVVAALAAD